jgi:hypothetical protein
MGGWLLLNYGIGTTVLLLSWELGWVHLDPTMRNQVTRGWTTKSRE